MQDKRKPLLRLMHCTNEDKRSKPSPAQAIALFSAACLPYQEEVESSSSETIQCEFCERTFSGRSRHHYRRHLRTHTGEKPFVCSRCGAGFRDRYNLGVHMRSHTGEKPFACSQCSFRTAHESDLTKHAATHSDDLPFLCPHCSRRFRHQKGLAAHVETHGEAAFECSQADCNKVYKSQARLNRHMRTAHLSIKQARATKVEKLPDQVDAVSMFASLNASSS